MALVYDNGERFWISQWRPRELLNVNLGLVRLLVWGPYPFVSLTFGLPAREMDYPVLQLYAGIKCDGTKSHTRGGYWMRLNLKECLAARIHNTDVDPAWDNQGGS